MADADEILLAMDDLELQAMVSAGRSLEEIQLMQKQKIYREQVSMYAYFEKSLHRDNSISNAKDVGIHLGTAYENLGKRTLAIDALHRANLRCPNDAVIILMLSRLLFRDNKKAEAASILLPFTETVKASLGAYGCSISADEAADAYYILGWIFIHADNHTRAYDIWSEGYDVIPTDLRLKRQRNKVQHWANIDKTTDNLAAISDCVPFAVDNSYQMTKLIGNGAHFNREFSRSRDFDSFEIPCDQEEPALGLFTADKQERKLVFRTKQPILTCDECAAVIEVVEDCVAQNRGGVWGSVRSASLPTTDVAVEDIPILRRWLRCLLATTLQPMLATCFPELADGSTMGPHGERLRVHDAFIVRYDADKDMSTSLPEHSDTSAVSLTVALNDPDFITCSETHSLNLGSGDYVSSDNDCMSNRIDNAGTGTTARYTFTGGGTWFRALQRRRREDPSGSGLTRGTEKIESTLDEDCNGVVETVAGQAVAFAGPLRHGGHEVTRGTRYILVLFMYVEDFAYQQYLCSAEPSPTTPSNVTSSVALSNSRSDAPTASTVFTETSHCSSGATGDSGGSSISAEDSLCNSSPATQDIDFKQGNYPMGDVAVSSSQSYMNSSTPTPPPPGLEGRRYVVYRETLELMTTLNKSQTVDGD